MIRLLSQPNRLLWFILLTFFSKSHAALRNVDDPRADPVLFSQQWLNIIAQADSSLKDNVFNVLSQRFQEARASVNISNEECSRALQHYFSDPFTKRWSVLMWDANGHLPSGLMSASLFEPGNYDQCMAIEGGGGEPAGQYCILNIRPPSPLTMVNFTTFTGNTKYGHMDTMVNYLTGWNEFSPISNGLCLPSTCTEHELNQIVPKVMLPQGIRFQATIALCQATRTMDKPLRFGQVVAL